MFKFGFGDNTSKEVVAKKEIIWQECSEISLQSTQKNIEQEDNNVRRHKVGSKELLTIPAFQDHVLEKNFSDKLLEAEKQHSDLIPGVYEGGLKIWECTYDLLNYLCSLSNFVWKNKNVLDLGCGAGLLGLLALINGSNVTFQDYNSDVLKYMTGPNIFLNATSEKELEKIRLFCGDWLSFRSILEKEKKGGIYDIILTSETIYNPENYEKLHDVFVNLLTKNGIAYLAAKSVYFGVGGSMHGFVEFVKSEGKLDIDICWSNNHGVSREICIIKHKENTKTSEHSTEEVVV